MSLSLSSKRDLRWWVTSLPTACRIIDHGLLTCVIATDASGMGFVNGGCDHTGTLEFRGEKTGHQYLELLAIQFSFSALLSNVHDQHVRVELDNTTVISLIQWEAVTHKCDRL